MASFFEPDSFLFDPTSYHDETPSSFLSFSSFSDLATSPFDFSAWDYGAGSSKKTNSTSSHQQHSLANQPSQTRSELSVSDTSSPCDPFEIIEAAFEPLTPAGEIGIFVAPAEKRLSLSSATPSSTTTSSSTSSASDPRQSSSSHSYRSSTSSDTWDDPVTPGLSARSSVESFASTSTIHPANIYKQPSQQPYSWDDASAGLGSASAPIYTSPISQQAHRTTSNPVLNPNSTRPRVPRPIASMPALKEEDVTTPSAWFDGTEQLGATIDLTTIGSASLPFHQQGVNNEASSLEVSDDLLVDDFDWVFGEYGLGMADLPPESTIFAAFQNNDDSMNPPSTSTSSTSNTDNINTFDVSNVDTILSQPQPVYQQQVPQQQQSQHVLQQDQQQTHQQQAWLPAPMAQDASGFPSYDFSSTIANLPSFTIDPMTLMASSMGDVEEPSRPSSAPGFNGGDGSGQLLSVPMPGQMTRSVSSEGFAHARHAPPRDLFSYAPQQIPAGPPIPQPLYTTDPSPSYFQPQQYTAPLTPTHSHSHGRRASVQGLSVQIQPTMYSTFTQSPLPPTPQSATTYGGEFAYQQQQAFPPQPIQMTRADTQPLPRTRKLSSSDTDTSNVPAHILRAQAIVQMQEAKEEAQRQEYRRQAASRRVDMSQASVMQPHPPRAQTIMGWEGPSAQTASLPVLTTTPLVTIHPPPAPYIGHPNNFNLVGASTTHRIHPPPHPGPAPSSRPISRLPTSPTKQRKVSASPKKSPAGKKRQAQTPAAGGFSWGETTFINFTPKDAEKLLTGVAPSGSQGKRKREEDMGKSSPMKGVSSIEGELIPVEMERDRSKRSRSNE